jgi:LysM repeat protein
MSDIAEAYDVTINEILSLNPEAEPELIRAGQVLLVPADSPVVGLANAAADSGSETDEFVVHVVSPGETLSTIAAEYGVSVSVIQRANDLSTDDETIRAEQSLVIPMHTPTPSPTPTVNPDLTPVAVPPYPSPPLLSPPDGAVLTDEAPVLLQWASIGILKADEWYELSLWELVRGGVLHTAYTRATAWRVPLDLVQRASSPNLTLRWRVRVVEEVGDDTYQEVGEPSATYEFVWRGKVSPESSTTTATP